MRTDLDNKEVEVFSYPWSYWYGNVVVVAVLLIAAIAVVYQGDSLGIVLMLTLGGILIALFIFQQIRRFQSPYRITFRLDGLHAERIWGESVFIPWQSVVSVEDFRLLLSDRCLRINLADGTSLTIEAGIIKISPTDRRVLITDGIKGLDQLKSKVRERIPSR